jgi:DNA-binding NtrC family response regulator/predicted ATPase
MEQPADLLGESPAMDAVRDNLRKLLDRQRAGQRLPPILLRGETGTGKGLVARLLHRHGARSRAPFVDVNCAAIPETLLEAELFGFERGAFTDAHRAKPGLFQAAHGGVLFLDEVGLLPDALQAKLLTVIEERAVRRLGSTRSEPADVWLISATNADLRAAIAAHRFRDDLYHRLAVLTLDLPPLRERGRDIILLAERFLARAVAEYGLPSTRFHADAETRLLTYAWPGNIRELGNVIERALLFNDGLEVTAESLGPLEAVGDGIASPGPSTNPLTSRDEAMRQQLLAALHETGWNVSLTAARLGIARNTVYTRLEKFGLRSEPPRRKASNVPPHKTIEAEPLPVATRLQWERRHIGLLRADLRSMDGNADWSQASRALECVIAKVQSFGGRVEEMTPSGLIAAFGLESVEDAPRRAAHAAVAIQIEARRTRAETGRGPDVAIGLHVMLALIGQVGALVAIDAESTRAQWPVLDGLLQAREPGETVVSGAAAPFLERRFELERLDAEDGHEPVYRLTGQERKGLGLWGAVSRFVGRREELDVLRKKSALAKDGEGQLVAVVGAAGVGKSRLIYEFTSAQRLAGWRVLEATALSHGAAMSYLPLAGLFKGYFKIEDRDDARDIREKVAGKLLTLDRALEPAVPGLLALLDVAVDDRWWQSLDPPQRRKRTLEAVRRLFLREAQVQPLLLVFEDLHWIDAETYALVDSLADSLAGAALLLLVNYRSGHQHAWGDRERHTFLELDPLSAEGAEELLEALLGQDASLVPLKDLLVKRTGRNPLFMEESVRTLVEARVLRGERGTYHLVQPVETIQVPATVETILAARVDRLPDEERRLLEIAAVIGMNVPFSLLHAIAEDSEQALRERLDRLQEGEFVYETHTAPDLVYSFVHALTHEVAYTSVLPDRRKRFHARIVDAIEALHGDRLNEQVEQLAHHAVRGEVWGKAATYFRQAGERALARSANVDAVGYLTGALDVLRAFPEGPDRAREELVLQLSLGPAAQATKGFASPDVEQIYRRARQLASEFGDPGQLFQAIWGQWMFAAVRGPLSAAREFGEQLLELAARERDRALLLQAHHALWPCLLWAPELEAAKAHLEQGMALYDREQHHRHAFIYGGHDPGVCCHMFAGLTFSILGQFDVAVRHVLDAQALANELAHPHSQALALQWTCQVQQLRGDAAAVLAVARELAALSTEHGFRQRLAAAHIFQGWARVAQGDADGAVELRRGLEGLHAIGDKLLLPYFLCLLAAVSLKVGQIDGGLATVAQALSFVDVSGDHIWDAELHRLRGEALLVGPQVPLEAEASLRRAIEIARRQGAKSWELRAVTSLGRWLETDGRAEEARALLQGCCRGFTEGFDTADWRDAQDLLSHLSSP